MHSLSQIDRALYLRALEKQNEVWDRIILALSTRRARGWTLRWTADPPITPEDVASDLEYGRD